MGEGWAGKWEGRSEAGSEWPWAKASEQPRAAAWAVKRAAVLGPASALGLAAESGSG